MGGDKMKHLEIDKSSEILERLSKSERELQLNEKENDLDSFRRCLT